MAWILGLFGLLILYPVDGSLKNAKIHPELPLVELKQHRHEMDQLEPDLAQTIFDGVQRNPLERTTTIRPPKAVRSPSIRGKRDSEPFSVVKPAEVHILDFSESDPFSEPAEDSVVESQQEYDNLNADFEEDQKVEQALNQTFIIDESLNLGNPTNETVIDEAEATVTSGPVDAAVIGTTVVQEQTTASPESVIPKLDTSETTVIPKLGTSKITVPPELGISETTVIPKLGTSKITVSSKSGISSEIIVTPKSETLFKTTVLQEVPTTTPKYNFSHNNNSATANLDRKILAFEIDSHNKKILHQKIQQSSTASPKTDIVFEEDPGVSKAQEDEKKQLVPPGPAPTPQPGFPAGKEVKTVQEKLRDFQNAEIFPQNSERSLLDSSVAKRRHIVSNYVSTGNQRLSRRQRDNAFKTVVFGRAKRASEMDSMEDVSDPAILEDDSVEKNQKIENLKFNETAPTESPEPSQISEGSTRNSSPPEDVPERRKIISNSLKKNRHVISNNIESKDVTTAPKEDLTLTTTEPTVSSTTTTVPSTTSTATTVPSTTSTATTVSSTTSTAATVPSTTSAAASKPTTTLPESRAERLKLLDSVPPRRGRVLGLVKVTRPPHNEVDAESAVDERHAHNPWKTHIQLHLSDESREVVHRSILKVLPKLVPVKKPSQPAEELDEEYKDYKKKEKPESMEFRDLPDASDKDAVRQPDVVKPKKIAGGRKLVQNQIPPNNPRPQAPTSVPVPQTSQPPPQPQLVLQPPPVPQPQFLPPPVTLNHFIVDGQRYIIRSYPAGWPQPPPTPVQQVFPAPVQQVSPPPVNPPMLTPPPPTTTATITTTTATTTIPSPQFDPLQDLPVPVQEKQLQTQKIVRNGNSRPNSPPVKQGHRVRQDEIRIVRIFQHYGTTKQTFVRPMSTQPFTTTEKPTPSTTRKGKTAPVTVTTQRTPTTPLTPVVITTKKPIPKNHVKHGDFDLYDEVNPVTTSTSPSTTTSTTTSTTNAAKSVSIEIMGNLKDSDKFMERDSPISDSLDYVTDEELTEEKAVRPAKNPDHSLRLVKIRNFVDADAAKREPARDFTGDAPSAKPDLRGFGERIVKVHG